jgi:hypothetical protein
MLTKEKIIDGINSLKDPINIDDVYEKIHLIEKIEKGLEQSQNDQIISDEEADKRIEKTLKSFLL